LKSEHRKFITACHYKSSFRFNFHYYKKKNLPSLTKKTPPSHKKNPTISQKKPHHLTKKTLPSHKKIFTILFTNKIKIIKIKIKPFFKKIYHPLKKKIIIKKKKFLKKNDKIIGSS
jgi:hypothetical protein